MDKDREEEMGHRRSARISALEEKAKALQKHPKTTIRNANISSPAAAAKRRGRKRKSLQDVVINSVATPSCQEKDNQKHEDTSNKSDQPENLSSLLRMPKKQTLEFVLDILQRRDTHEIFAQPVDSEEVVGYYNIIKEPMDFGTMRAKLQEGMYNSFEQFERDVFLISSNAMKFNSSTTVYYTEARAISELAHRVLHALRTEPENFELEYSRTRRRAVRKPQGETGGSHPNLAKFSCVKDGPSLKDPSLKRTAQTNLASSRPNACLEKMNNKIPSGSRDVRRVNFPEIDRRMTYKPQTSLYNENKSIVSTVYNAPKLLNHVTDAGTRYIESLREFVKDLGPTAKMVANKKLAKLPIGAPKFPSWTPNTFSKATAFLLPAIVPQASGYTNSVNHVQMPHGSNFNWPGSYKGKMVSANKGMNMCNTSEGEIIPNHNGLQGKRAQASNGGQINCTLLREKGINTSSNMNVSGSSQQIKTGTGENTDLLVATLMQISAIQNRNAHTICSYFSLTGVEDLHAAKRSQYIDESQSWLPNNNSDPMLLPPQTAKLSSMNQDTTSFHGFGSLYPTGEGPSTAAAALDHISTLPFQPLEWSQPMVWGAQATSDLPIMQTQVNEQILSGQNVFVQQQSQVASTQEIPLFDTMSFLEGANLQGQKAESSVRCLWDTQRSSLMDNQQPDLALQL